MSTKTDRFTNELESFRGLWKGGYFEGDPLDPLAPSSYGELGYVSVLHATYLTCIKPYVTGDSAVIEIGPGRGAWTRTFLHARRVYCLDALSAEHNGFWRYVGHAPNVSYYQVADLTCQMLPDNQCDYLFSFGALCHVSFEGITAYMQNLYPKLKPDAHAFVMIADYDKYNAAVQALDRNSVLNALEPLARDKPEHLTLIALCKLLRRGRRLEPKGPDRDTIPSPGRWYHAGTQRTCAMLEGIGYEIITPDVGTLLRDPIIHFTK